MPTDRVLILVETAANVAGLEKAKGGMAGLGTSLVIAGAAAGLFIEVGKSMIEIADKHETAERGLSQAINIRGGSLKDAQKDIDEFIVTNRRYISDQSEVIDSYAKLTRAGLSQDEVQKDMNRALDLSALKHISLGEATDLLVKAEQGRLRGLIDLGISTGKYTDAEGNLVNGTKDVQRVMEELDPKLKDGRKSQSDLKQASQELGNAWQTIAIENGPALENAVAGALTKTAEFLNFLRNSDWAGASEFLVGLAKGWHDLTWQIDQANQSMKEFLIQHGITTQAGSTAGAGGKFSTNNSAIALRQRGFMLTSN